MVTTIHLNGTSLSLAHKGSMGVSKSTLPDVCKTPTPAGPQPIPYPIIVSMTSDLAKGTTTVKADGGNMIAIKGSELSRCMGDEPGSAGGVKSSTNMKEATWILYSPDVKIEGKNACRLSDKLQMNHGNTACLGGLIQTPVAGQFILELECKSTWDSCQKAQMKAKADALDKVAKKRGFLQTRSPSKTNPLLRRVGGKFQKLFRELHTATTATGKFPSALEPAAQGATHLDDCAKTNVDQSTGKVRACDADHVLELQFTGGNPAGPLRMLDASVNRSCGAQIAHQRKVNGEFKVVGVQTKGC